VRDAARDEDERARAGDHLAAGKDEGQLPVADVSAVVGVRMDVHGGPSPAGARATITR
jgi:hypothetical protein